MTPRVFLLATLVLICGPASAAAAAARPVPVAPMVFYVVKGAPDACGRGCDSWIAAEGQIDAAAAPRFRKFLRRVRDRNLPIYFASPGGNLDQALAMGAMLRERPVVARVARTVVRECGFEAQDSEVCLKLKQSDRELHGDLWTRNASCNSACPYLILGAATREIAPDALLAVHSPKVVAHFRNGVPTPQMQAAANARGRERADRMLTEYIARMGAEMGLLVLARTVKYEDRRLLTRDEIERFGIDRRDVVETPWTFENAGRSVVHKTVLQKLTSDGSFRSSQWRLFCNNADQFELNLKRQAMAPTFLPAVSISNGGTKPLYFVSAAGRVARVQSMGHAYDQGIGSVLGRTGSVRPHRNVAGAGRARAHPLDDIFHRRIGRRRQQPAHNVLRSKRYRGDGGTGRTRERREIIRSRPFLPRLHGLHAFA